MGFVKKKKVPMKWVAYYYHAESESTGIMGVADTEDDAWGIIENEPCSGFPPDYFVEKVKYVKGKNDGI